MDKYLNYHKKPYAKYLTVHQFNNKFGSELSVSSTFDSEFMAKYTVARKRAGQDDYITTGLNMVRSRKQSPVPMSKPIESKESIDDFLGREVEKSVQSQIEDIVLERAKDARSGDMDLKNIVHFNAPNTDLKDRLMKGTKQNLAQLKAYYKGDESASIRMSYKDGDKETKISDLNPSKTSLKAFLKNPKGVREVSCL